MIAGKKQKLSFICMIISGLCLSVIISVFSVGHLSASEDQGFSQQLIFDFNSKDEIINWRIVNDVVMGGLSRSELSIVSESIAVFRGTISLKNNGGFASVRTYPGDYNLSGFGGILIRVKGDGKKYQLRLRMGNQFDGISYKAGFQTTPKKWTTVYLDFGNFAPSYHGRLVADAPALTPSKIRQIGFLIADKQEGSFNLEIDWIKAFRE